MTSRWTTFSRWVLLTGDRRAVAAALLAAFAVLSAYVVRVAAVSRRTESPGHFVFGDGEPGVPGVSSR